MNRQPLTRTIVRCLIAAGIGLSLLLAGGAPGGDHLYTPATTIELPVQW